MEYTSNYNLGLPVVTEKYDVTIVNSNNTVIDSQMKINEDAITSHTGNTNNPHGVTKQQVGLGSVDNTSDATKPVSTPQQQYIAQQIQAEKARAEAAESANESAITAVENALPSTATTQSEGLVKPDGTTITISDGVISATQPTIDSELSTTSSNAVKNSVITTALNGKQATLTFDQTPTSGSNNPVTSDGLNTALNTKANAATTYTKTEVDNMFSSIQSGTDWKEAVATFADIATTYSNPEDGWTVNVKDTDYTYRYDGTDWVVISANAIPNATSSLNGLATAAQITDLEANTVARHSHSNKSILDGTTASFTSELATKLSGISDSADAVEYTALQSSGAKLGTITINGTDHDIYAPDASSVSFSRDLSSGTKIGTITINGTSTDIYSPTPITTDATASAHGLMSATDKIKANYTNIAYATCGTAATEQVKVATVVSNTSWSLEVGAIVGVLFTYTNTYSATTDAPCMLNVNGTGAKNIYYNNTSVPTGTNTNCFGYANRMAYYMYNGTYWMWLGMGVDNNTTYSPYTLGFGYGTCATAAATTEKAVTLSNYALVSGGIIAVRFTYAVPASATLNVNTRGAKAIYYKGAAIKAGVINAGDTAIFFYNGSYYHLLGKDSASPPYVTGTLAAGSTSITLSNSNITTSSTIDGPYCSIAGVSGQVTAVADGSLTCTFDAQSSAMTVKCYIRND